MPFTALKSYDSVLILYKSVNLGILFAGHTKGRVVKSKENPGKNHFELMFGCLNLIDVHYDNLYCF